MPELKGQLLLLMKNMDLMYGLVYPHGRKGPGGPVEDLIRYISESKKDGEGIWNTNIFGKSIGELMEDGIRTKIQQMDDECQIKLQDTMQKIVNDSKGGMICIII